jgi:hypothetical protein
LGFGWRIGNSPTEKSWHVCPSKHGIQEIIKDIIRKQCYYTYTDTPEVVGVIETTPVLLPSTQGAIKAFVWPPHHAFILGSKIYRNRD